MSNGNQRDPIDIELERFAKRQREYQREQEELARPEHDQQPFQEWLYVRSRGKRGGVRLVVQPDASRDADSKNEASNQ